MIAGVEVHATARKREAPACVPTKAERRAVLDVLRGQAAAERDEALACDRLARGQVLAVSVAWLAAARRHRERERAIRVAMTWMKEIVI